VVALARGKVFSRIKGEATGGMGEDEPMVGRARKNDEKNFELKST
jgi:hypothetical protein